MDTMEGPTTLSEEVQMTNKNIGLRFMLEEYVDLLLLCPNIANKKKQEAVSNRQVQTKFWLIEVICVQKLGSLN